MSKKKYYIGLSVTYHDPALAIVDEDGEVLFAEATERYLQYKRAVNCEPDSLHRIVELIHTYCDRDADFVVALNWSRKRPFYETYCALADYFSPTGLLRPRFKRYSTFLEKYKLFHMLACQRNSMAKGGINLVRRLREAAPASRLSFVNLNHHLCHAAMACYSSPFTEAVCMIVDSYGERGSMAFYYYQNGRLKLLHESKGIESLGFLYMKITEQCGFDWMKGEEWKVMGLAPYGKLDDKLYATLSAMITVQGLRCRQRLSSINAGLQILEKSRCGDPQRAADIAYTGQRIFADLMSKIIGNLAEIGYSHHLILGGGCALNSSFNGQILASSNFKKLHIPSAPADDGTALGAAWLAYYRDHPKRVPVPKHLSPYLGSSLSAKTLQRVIQTAKTPHVRHLPDSLCTETAKLLAQGKLVGWLQGRAEFGPRALGCRSILADPRNAHIKDKINQQVKFREAFRPFAPAIMHEFGEHYFENYQSSPYMERTLRYRDEIYQQVPAVVHVDQTGRVQTVKREWNERFYALIKAFYELTSVPILLNTSFNVMDKPIVHSVEDAMAVFFTTGLDVMVIEDYLFLK